MPSPSRTSRSLAPLHLALTVVATMALTACATFTDNRVAARVGDASLERSQLDDLIIGATPGATDRVTVPLGTAQDLLNTWILTEVLRDELEAAGAGLTDEHRRDAQSQLEASFGAEWSESTPEALRNLQIEQRAAISAWSNLEVEAPSEDQLSRAYARGPEESGIACVAHILVETSGEADEVTAELDAGADFAELASQRSTDPGSAQAGGALPCVSANEFARSFIPEFVAAAFDARIGEPTEPFESQFGYHVLVVRPFDEVRDEGIEQIYTSDEVRFRRASRSADVHVDPRYGAFDPDAGVVTLG